MTPFAATLVINLLPVLSVIMFDWSALTLVLLYWIENLIVGGFNVIKILSAGFSNGRAGTVGALVVTPFFIFHYGLFCFVHGVFIVAMFSIGTEAQPAVTLSGLGEVVTAQLRNSPALFWNIVVLAAFHFYLFLRYWVVGGQWRNADPFTQMFAPYARIIVVHLTIMIAAIPVLLLGQPIVAVVCLALLKTGLETGRMRLFDAFAENPRLAEKMRRTLRVLNNHARH